MARPDPKWLTVACPTCQAKPKRACLSKDGLKFKQWPHPARINLYKETHDDHA